MKIIMLNLDRSTTKEELRVLFEEYGTVESCVLVLDKDTGESKGFGFVKMQKQEEAELAIKKMNNRKVANNRIRVKKVETVKK